MDRFSFSLLRPLALLAIVSMMLVGCSSEPTTEGAASNKPVPAGEAPKGTAPQQPQ